MSLATITLSTNKSFRVINGDRRRLRQSEKGLVLKVELLNQQGAAYDLTNKALVFSENKDGGKIVVDDRSEAFTITDAKAGKFEYKLHSQVYTDSGVAWFEIKDGAEVIDTTRDFYFDVIKDAIYNPANDNYISTLGALEDHYKGVIQKSEQDVSAIIDKFKEDVASAISSGKDDISDEIKDAQSKIAELEKSGNDLIDQMKQSYQYNNQKLIDLQNEWKTQTKAIQDTADSQIAKIKADAQEQIDQINTEASNTISAINKQAQDQANAIQAKADKQLQDNQKDHDDEIAKLEQQLSDDKLANDNELKRVSDSLNSKLDEVETAKSNAIAEIEKERDNALKVANESFNQKIDSMQSDYDSWKATQVADFTAQVKALSDRLTQDETTESELDQKLKTLQTSVEQAEKDFASVDFSKFALISDTYNKSEVDALVASAGKVKTVDGKQPDTNGNIEIDFSKIKFRKQYIDSSTNLVQKTWTATKGSDGTYTIDLYNDDWTANKVKELLNKIGAKADKTDLDGLASQLSQLTNSVYTKAETDSKIAQGGKVKTVNSQQPDGSGNVTIDVGVTSVNGQTGAVTDIAKTSDIKVTSVNGQTGDVVVKSGVTSVNGQTGDVKDLATSTQITDLQNQITKLSENMIPFLITDDATKAKEFSEKVQGGVGIVETN